MNELRRILVDKTSAHTILIAEPHALIRHALMALLHQAGPSWQCDDVDPSEPNTSAYMTLFHRIQETAPRLVLLDLGLCGLDGLRQLRLHFPLTLFAVLSDQSDRAAILSCLEAGAQGYILKTTSPEQFVRALQTILSGGLFAPASLSVTPLHAPAPPPASTLAARPLPALTHLTERQRDVFELLAEGCATKTIARRLDLAVGTVKVHLAGIYRALGASSRLEAVAKAHRGLAAQSAIV